MLAGDGKTRVRDEKQTSVFKRALNVEYHLKLKTSRTILSEINKRYPCMPFPLRKLLEEGSTSRLGLVECVQHGLLQSYPVLWEKDGAMVAQVKATVLLLPNGSDRITRGPTQALQCSTKISVCLALPVDKLPVKLASAEPMGRTSRAATIELVMSDGLNTVPESMSLYQPIGEAILG